MKIQEAQSTRFDQKCQGVVKTNQINENAEDTTKTQVRDEISRLEDGRTRKERRMVKQEVSHFP